MGKSSLSSPGHSTRSPSCAAPSDAPPASGQAAEPFSDCSRLLERVERIARVGGWGMDLTSQTRKWTRGTYAILELELETPPSGPDAFLEYIHPAFRVTVSNAFQALMGSGAPMDVETRAHTAKGKEIWLRVQGRTEMRDGVCVKVFGTLHDITNSKMTEERLRDNEVQMARQMRELNCLYALSRLTQSSDGTLNDILRDSVRVIPSAWENPELTCVRLKLGDQEFASANCRTPDSKVAQPIYVSGAPVGVLEVGHLSDDSVPIAQGFTDDEVRMIGVFAEHLQSVIARAWVEEERVDEATRRRILIDQSRDGIVVVTQDGGVYEANQRFAEMLGYTYDEVTDLHVWDWEYLYPKEALQGMIREVDETGQHLETKHRRKDGSTYDVEICSNAAVFAGQKLIFCVCRDISERRQAEEELKRAEQEARDLLGAIHVGLMTIDPDSLRVLDCNPVALRMFGRAREQIVGRDSNPLFCDPLLGDRDGSTVSSDTHSTEAELLTADGQTVPIQRTVSRISVKGEDVLLVTFIDISNLKEAERERQELQMEILQARKLESVGSLAAGIAHEINTPIQFISDNVSFMAESFKTLKSLLQSYDDLWHAGMDGGNWTTLDTQRTKAKKGADWEYLAHETALASDQALDGVHRVAKIVRAMKDFAHSDHGAKSIVNVNELLAGTLTVAQNELKYVADVDTRFAADLPEIQCYRDDLNQVFLNLLVNSAQAISEVVGDGSVGKGQITVTTRTEGESIAVEIADTGSGIPAAVRDRIFDPFFTTKEVGRGTGQGLSISRKIIVDKHKGTLGFTTTEGQGTIFTIRLPIELPSDTESCSP